MILKTRAASLFALLTVCFLAFPREANSQVKISELPAVTTAASDDLVIVVQGTGTAAITKKATLAQITASLGVSDAFTFSSGTLTLSGTQAGNFNWTGTNDFSGTLTIGGVAAVTISGTQTLTNKAIDGDDNTLQDIPISALTESTVTLALGTSGTDANVSGSPVDLGGTVTLNLPSASASNRGLLTAADYTTFATALQPDGDGSGLTGMFVTGTTGSGLNLMFAEVATIPGGGGADTGQLFATNQKLYVSGLYDQADGETVLRVFDREIFFGENIGTVNFPNSGVKEAWLDALGIDYTGAGTIFVSKGATATDTRTGVSPYDVTTPFATLTAAQAAASSGDTIIVQTGTYSEHSLGRDGVNWILVSAVIDWSGDSTGADARYIFGDAPGDVSSAMSYSVSGNGIIRCADDSGGGALIYGIYVSNAGSDISIAAKEVYASELAFESNRGTAIGIIDGALTLDIGKVTALGTGLEIEGGTVRGKCRLVHAVEEHAFAMYGGDVLLVVPEIHSEGNDALLQSGGNLKLSSVTITGDDGAGVFVNGTTAIADISAQSIEATSLGIGMVLRGNSVRINANYIKNADIDTPALRFTGTGNVLVSNAYIVASGSGSPAIDLQDNGAAIFNCILVAGESANAVVVPSGTLSMRIYGSNVANSAVGSGVDQQVGTILIDSDVR